MEPNPMATRPATERDFAPDTVSPRTMQVERMGESSSPMVFTFPDVRGGICEYCGVMDGNYPSEYQYKLCQHYRGKQLQCSYCPQGKDPDDVINHSVLKIYSHPDNPKKMVICCNSYECSKKHEQRWKIGV